MNLKLCECKKVFLRNKWTPFNSIDEVFKKFDITEWEEFPLNPGIKRKMQVKKGDAMVFIGIEVTYCDRCRLKKSQYYEGILQIKHATPEVVNFADNEIGKAGAKGKYITKRVVKDDRADYYLTDQTYMKSLAHKIQKEFGGAIQKNAQLFSHSKQESKDLFRVNLLLELPLFKKQDVIVINEKPYIVISLKEKINVMDFAGKKTSVPYKDYETLEKVEARISKIYPDIEIIDPVSFQSVPVENKKTVHINEKVMVVQYRGWWIV
ncbi:hypothetical protein C4573_04020 [Candidatus Woesearchaeota archaeon]|nr:MAG: hypothetical protein C4573_04020 [Candidatus Woesearchaeota archaeon]